MAGSTDETGTAKVKGPASYFPSIEKTYGQPIDHWLDLDADLTFGQLTLSQLPIHNAALKATGQGGLLTL